MTNYEKQTGVLVKLKTTTFQVVEFNHTGHYFTTMLESIWAVSFTLQSNSLKLFFVFMVEVKSDYFQILLFANDIGYSSLPTLDAE